MFSNPYETCAPSHVFDFVLKNRGSPYTRL
jgi:hypothetical protein